VEETIWHRNKTRTERIYLALFFLCIAITLAVYLALGATGAIGGGDILCLIGAWFVLLVSVIFAMAFFLMMRDAPGEIGTGPGGICFRFPGLMRPDRTDTIAWAEILSIEDHTGAGNMTFALTLKDATRREYTIDPFLQAELAKLVTENLPGEDEEAPAGPGPVAKESGWTERPSDGTVVQTVKFDEKAPPAPGPPQKGPSAPDVRWLESNYRMGLIANFLLLFAVLEFLAYIFWGYFSAAMPICFIMGAIGWILLTGFVLLLTPKSPVGLSDAGVHISAYPLDRKKDRFIAWDDIVRLRPAVGDTLTLVVKSGTRITADSAGKRVIKEVMGALEERYDRHHPVARRINSADNRMGGIENSCKARIRGRSLLSLSIGIASTILVVADTLGYLDVSHDLNSVLSIVAGAGMAYGAALQFDLRKLIDSVAVTDIGVWMRYPGDVPDQGTGFVAWPDLAALEPPEKGDPEKDPSKAVVLVKKSGASYFLGPADPAIIKEIRSRAASMLK
jgi:hypothetical protein